MTLLLVSMISGYCVIVAEPLDDSDPSAGDDIARSLAGTPPEIRSAPLDPTPATSGQETSFSFWVRDMDSTFLNLTWDWGDGIVETTNRTFAVGSNVNIIGVHTYDPIPEPGRSTYDVTYTFNFTITDPDLNWDWDITTVICTVNVTNASPTSLTLTANSTIVDPSDEVYIMASAIDPEGEALTWTFKFTDNESQVYRIVCFHTPTSAPGQRVWSNLTHVFGTLGTHKVYVNISDALPPYQLFPHNVSTNLAFTVKINVVPDVSAAIETTPTDLVVPAEVGYGLMVYKIQAFDNDGDVLTVTWNFGDGTPDVVNVSAGGTATYFFYQIRNYTDGGVFNVTVNVTDGVPGHLVSLYKIVVVQSTNLPPLFVTGAVVYWGGGSEGRPNQTVNFTIVIQDPESDPVSVRIDFGDGSPLLFTNLTEFVDHNATFSFTHNYTVVGDYDINITYSDNKIGKYNHTKNVTLDVRIYVPPVPRVVIWDAWDYISLGLFCMIPILIAARMIMVARRRKQLEKEGMTLEEWKLVSSEMGIQEKKT